MALLLPTDGQDLLVLPADAALRAVPPDRSSRHGDLGFRPPVGTYNTSIWTIAQRYARVLSALSAVASRSDRERGGKSDGADELLDAQEALLHALMHHMEECVAIMKGFTEDDKAFRKSPAAKRYGHAVREYRTHIGSVVNRIKHHQGRLRFLQARLHRLPHVSFCGYFVEGAFAAGGVGPDPTIHAGGTGAFSLNRDLRYHLCHLLLTSEALGTAVGTLTGAGQADAGLRLQPLMPAIVGVASLPETYFPDEYEKPRPILRVEPVNDRQQLRVDFASSRGWRRLLATYSRCGLLFTAMESLEVGEFRIPPPTRMACSEPEHCRILKKLNKG